MSNIRELSCDTVFEVLTLPSERHEEGTPELGARELAVQRHLDGCMQCRALAGSIAPAVALLRADRDCFSRDAFDSKAAVGVPSGASAPKDVAAVQGGRESSPPGQSSGGRGVGWTSGRDGFGQPSGRARGLPLFFAVAATFLLGMLIFSDAGGILGKRENDRPKPSIHSLGLATACWQGDVAAARSVACCTQCHAAGGHSSTANVSMAGNQRARASLLLSCQICHTP